jgi:hypothetical protein
MDAISASISDENFDHTAESAIDISAYRPANGGTVGATRLAPDNGVRRCPARDADEVQRSHDRGDSDAIPWLGMPRGTAATRRQARRLLRSAADRLHRPGHHLIRELVQQTAHQH